MASGFMSRNNRTRFRVIAMLLVLALSSGFWLPGSSNSNSSSSLQALPSNLIAYDTAPLDDRMPLILVHGIGGDDPSDHYHWQNFLNHTRSKKAFNQKFKIYLFTYDTAKSVPEGSANFQNAMRQFLAQTTSDIKIVGYSEGGLLVRNAMQDELIDKRTKEVITIATPFHGSPLATPRWFRQQLETEAALSPVKLSERFAYWVAFKKHPSLGTDFQWDNFDSAIPEDVYKSINGRGVITGYKLASRDNFITYGSYFGEEVVDPERQLPKELGVTDELPKEKSKLKNLFRQNILFSFVNKNMSKVTHFVWPHQAEEKIELDEDAMTVLAVVPEAAESAALQADDITLRTEKDTFVPEPEEDSENTSLTAYNDGISPISSSLWLGRFTPGFSTITSPISKLWAALKGLKGTNQARLFAGMDHRNWMDGETRTSSNSVRDLLNPDENPKTVFDWIVFDLMS